MLPRVRPDHTLDHHAVRGPDELTPGPFGIAEPRPSCPTVAPAALDVILVPGVAFDRAGGRLGYGGGFYDRFLAACTGPRLGLAFALQLVACVPREAHDLPLAVLVTEAEVIRVAPPDR